jgi:hypothetical protein
MGQSNGNARSEPGDRRLNKKHQLLEAVCGSGTT